MDEVFKALADPTRRRLLDALRQRDGQSLRELGEHLDMTRQAVAKHLGVLAAANLVTTLRRGREKLHFLNAAPIGEVADRWISPYHRERANALADLKRALEDPMDKTEFVYVTYIKTTPEKLWQALTDPAFTKRYWGAELQSDWQQGSPVLWREASPEFIDYGSEVLEFDPPRRLAYSWHMPRREHADYLGWSDDQLTRAQAEPRSRVSFDLEPEGETVKLTVVHDGFAPGSDMLKAVSGGWPAILASLKSLLETGDALPAATSWKERVTTS